MDSGAPRGPGGKRERARALETDPTRFASLTDLPDAGHRHPGIREVSDAFHTQNCGLLLKKILP